jgi:hypothetical protein
VIKRRLSEEKKETPNQFPRSSKKPLKNFPALFLSRQNGITCSKKKGFAETSIFQQNL